MAKAVTQKQPTPKQSIGWRQNINDFLGVPLFNIRPEPLSNQGDPQTPIGSIFSPVTVTQPAVYPDSNTINYIERGYLKNGSVFTIVSKVASKFGSIPRYAYKIKDQKAARDIKAVVKQKGFKLSQLKELNIKAYDEQIVDNKFSQLLQNPNPMMGQDEFYELCCVNRMVTGNCFIWLNRGDITGKTDRQADAMPVLEMFPLATGYVEIVPDPENVFGLLYYQFKVNGVRWKIRKSDMVHWKAPNPEFDGVTRKHMYGPSPLRAGAKWLTEDETGTDSTVAAYQNDGAKGVLFQTANPNPSPTQKAEIDAVINRKLNSRDMRGAVVALQGTWDYADLAQTGQEMERMNGRDRAFVRLCNLFGAPAMLFDTNTTFSNVEQAEKALVTNLVAPYAASLRDAMNAKLLPAFGLTASYTHDIDISQLPELQTEMKDLATTLSMCWWWSPNQKLKAQNQDESSDPNMDKVWIPNNLVLMDDAALPNQIDSYDGTDPTNPDDPGADGSTDPADAGDDLPNSSQSDPGTGD